MGAALQLAKFEDEACETYRVLEARLADDARFEHVLFVMVEANQTPVTAKEVAFSKAPFIVTYRKGHVEHCETVKTGARVEEMLTGFLVKKAYLTYWSTIPAPLPGV